MTTLQERIKRIESNPFQIFTGATDLRSHQGEGSMLLTVNSSIVNPNGTLHGGILYALADVCAFVALSSLLKADQDAVTHDIHVSVMRAAHLNDELRFSAKVSKLGRTLAFIKTQVYRSNEIISEASVTKSIISA